MHTTLQTALLQVSVIPVIVIKDAALAVDLAHALVAGGLNVLEITLRTAGALEAVRQIRAQIPTAIVGVGTLLNRTHIAQSIDAGAQFGISPGLTAELVAAAQHFNFPFIPGVATASEAMRAQDEGFLIQKLFPAEAVGGLALLKSLAAPLPSIQFCPTGGINYARAQHYLQLPNVFAVGGSWLTPEHAQVQRDWSHITMLAKEASQLQSP